MREEKWCAKHLYVEMLEIYLASKNRFLHRREKKTWNWIFSLRRRSVWWDLLVWCFGECELENQTRRFRCATHKRSRHFRLFMVIYCGFGTRTVMFNAMTLIESFWGAMNLSRNWYWPLISRSFVHPLVRSQHCCTFHRAAISDDKLTNMCWQTTKWFTRVAVMKKTHKEGKQKAKRILRLTCFQIHSESGPLIGQHLENWW